MIEEDEVPQEVPQEDLTPEAVIEGRLAGGVAHRVPAPWTRLVPAAEWAGDVAGCRARRMSETAHLCVDALWIASEPGDGGEVFVSHAAEWAAERWRRPASGASWSHPQHGRRHVVDLDQLWIEELVAAPVAGDRRDASWWQGPARWARAAGDKDSHLLREPIPAMHAGPLVGRRAHITRFGSQPLTHWVIASEPRENEDRDWVVSVVPEEQFWLVGEAREVLWDEAAQAYISDVWVIT